MNNLLLSAKSGDLIAVQELLLKYENLLKKAAGQHHLYSIREEAYAEAMMGLYTAIMDFDESLGIPFAGFAKSRVYQAVHNLFRKYVRIWQHEVALSGSDEGDDGNTVELFVDDLQIAESVSLKIDVQRALQQMPAAQYQVFCLIVIQGLSQKQVAQQLQVSQQMVSKNYRKAMAFINDSLVLKEA